VYFTGKTATQSTYYFENIAADVGFDGVYKPSEEAQAGVSGKYESYYALHTKLEPEPWVLVDLHQPFCIKGVKIWNRYLNYIIMRKLVSWNLTKIY